MSVDTFETRRRIEQVVNNEYPGCEIVYVDAQPGCLSFRLRSESGKFRTGVISLLSHHQHVRVNSAWLAREVTLHPPLHH